ncbi:MAG TPA: OB-fold domain-containing protein [Acidimicrobiales bacterium]|nr:OB-fold domain-containing protein [Acidimicrobiales bacterium]
MSRFTSEAHLPGLRQPAPANDGLDAPFWEGTRAHELRVQRCRSCEIHQWGPEWMCHACNSMELDWVTVDPVGQIYSWQRPHHPVHRALSDRGPYIIVLVELPHADNLRMVGNLLGDPLQEIKIGASVSVVFEDHDDGDPDFTLVQWEVTPAS